MLNRVAETLEQHGCMRLLDGAEVRAFALAPVDQRISVSATLKVNTSLSNI